MARPHDGPLEIARRLQHRLTGDLVLAVGPVWVHSRRLLGDDVIARRLLVNRRRRYEDVLACIARKDGDIRGDLRRREGYELANDVETAIAERVIGDGVFQVARDRGPPRGQVGAGHAPIEYGDVVAGRDGFGDAGKRDVACTADEQNFFGHEGLAPGSGRRLATTGASA